MKLTLVQELIRELIVFTYKQTRAGIFAGSFILLLFFSYSIPLFEILRYDRIFLGALLIQFILLLTRIETVVEFQVICLFHVIGLILEIFKTSPTIMAWSYPEAGLLKIANVPIYSGFMYAAVASYMSQSWKQFHLKLANYPSYWFSIPLVVIVYFNFFTHHYLPDIRWILIGFLFIVFFKTKVYFTITKKERSLPVFISFFLIGFFIYIAENVSTYLGAWKYPHQTLLWEPVHPNKITSWFLFAIISFIIVADLKHFRERRASGEGS